MGLIPKVSIWGKVKFPVRTPGILLLKQLVSNWISAHPDGVDGQSQPVPKLEMEE